MKKKLWAAQAIAQLAAEAAQQKIQAAQAIAQLAAAALL